MSTEKPFGTAGSQPDPDVVEAARQRLLDQVSHATPEELAAMLTGRQAPATAPDFVAPATPVDSGVQAGGASAAPGGSPVAADYDLLGLDDDMPDEVVPTTRREPRKPFTQNKPLRYLALALAAALVVFGVYSFGDRGSSAQAGASTSPSASAVAVSTPTPPDPAMVKALEAKIKANPKDTLSMKALGEVYAQAEQYKQAAAWQQKVVAITPTDTDAWLALGVAQFNAGNLKAAETAWDKAAALAPRRAEVFYNLGFLYYSQGKTTQAQAAWQKVVDIDPTSDLAQTVKSHIKARSASPTASASATPSATPSH